MMLRNSDLTSRAAGWRRRDFLRASALAGVALSTSHSPHPAVGDEPNGPRAEDLVAGKDPRLKVLLADPTVLSTPLSLLAEQRLTPATQLFVRNNQLLAGAATMQPLPLDGWKFELAGLLRKPQVVDATSLAELDQVEYEMVVQCSGTGRALFSKAAQTKGTQWDRGGIANVRFRGVRLRDLLAHLKVEVDDRARFVAAEGQDGPPAGSEDFEHSLPIDDVLRTSLLATHLNGEPLPAIHGGPLRLVTPGVYGTMHLKWLSRLRFEAEETRNYNHIPRYRVPLQPIQPGEAIEYTLTNSRFNWWMNVKSVVLAPEAGSTLPAGRLAIRGVAFNDGAAPLTSVLISLDQGQTWRQARLNAPASPYAWYPWQFTVNARPGKLSIWSRAIDAWGRSQPLDGSVFWNPSGYEWNGVEQIDVTIT